MLPPLKPAIPMAVLPLVSIVVPVTLLAATTDTLPLLRPAKLLKMLPTSTPPPVDVRLIALPPELMELVTVICCPACTTRSVIELNGRGSNPYMLAVPVETTRDAVAELGVMLPERLTPPLVDRRVIAPPITAASLNGELVNPGPP